MKSRWASLLLCLAWPPAASADAAAPAPQFNVPTAIPTGGVLPVFGSCFDGGECTILRSIVVTDKTSGTAIAGHVEIANSNTFEGWGYFVPDKPLVSGTVLLVKPMGGYPVTNATVSVLASSAFGADAVTLTTTLGKQRSVFASTCCPSSGSSAKPRCLDTSVLNGAALQATLSAAKPIATQYVYEVRLFAEGDPTAATVRDFGPLNSDARVPPFRAIFEMADRYCYTVRAKPLLGGEPVTLLEHCIDNDLTDLGRVERTPNEVLSWTATCQVGPLGVDGGTALEGDSLGDDERYDADEAGDLADRAEQPRVSGQDSGCQLSSAPGLLGVWYALPLVLLWRVKRKRGA